MSEITWLKEFKDIVFAAPWAAAFTVVCVFAIKKLPEIIEKWTTRPRYSDLKTFDDKYVSREVCHSHIDKVSEEIKRQSASQDALFTKVENVMNSLIAHIDK